jgi:hypothetical protein
MEELEKIKYWKSLLRGMKESASLKEETILKEIELAKTDPKIKTMLEILYLDEDREASFQRFCSSMEFKVTFEEIVRHAEYDWNVKICEVGAGSGFLAVALAKAGFHNVSILEPNRDWITGTGFIADYARKYGVRIWNDLDSWYEAEELYDLIITKACVHHFDNACKVGAEIRFKLDKHGKWMMFDEFFANSSEDLLSVLNNHVHAAKYGQYEWPYSASLYAELMDLAGYTLEEVIPNRYKNSYLCRNISEKRKLAKTVTIAAKILIALHLTVIAFKLERFIDRCVLINTKFRLFTLPQLIVLRPKAVAFPWNA